MAPRNPDVPRGEFDYETPTGMQWREFMEARMRRLEMRDATMHGMDGGGDGQWKQHREEDEAMHKKVEEHEKLRVQVLLLAVLSVPVAGFLAALLSHYIEKHM
jgi:hypothetical protein